MGRGGTPGGLPREQGRLSPLGPRWPAADFQLRRQPQDPVRRLAPDTLDQRAHTGCRNLRRQRAGFLRTWLSHLHRQANPRVAQLSLHDPGDRRRPDRITPPDRHHS
jgi:hypothetical protein